MADGTWNTCYKCKTDMWIPRPLQESALCNRGVIQFFCAYGHGQYYIEGESEESKLRRERDRLKQDAARLEYECIDTIARADKAEKAIKRLKKRASAGTCPCCQRTFSNMATHMRNQHPSFGDKPTLKVVA